MEDTGRPRDGLPVEEGDLDEPHVPISFWVMLALVALYLGWRLVQGVGVVISWIAG